MLAATAGNRMALREKTCLVSASLHTSNRTAAMPCSSASRTPSMMWGDFAGFCRSPATIEDSAEGHTQVDSTLPRPKNSWRGLHRRFVGMTMFRPCRTVVEILMWTRSIRGGIRDCREGFR